MSKSFIPPFTRRRLLQTSAGLAAASAAASFLPKRDVLAFSGQPVPDYGTTQTGAAFTVNTTHVGSIGAGYVGLSYEKATMWESYFNSSNTAMIQMFKTLQPNGGVLRIGGASVDTAVWEGTGTGGVSHKIYSGDIDNLYGFLNALGNWTCIYGVNMGGSGPNANSSYATTAALAASEAKYAASKLGSYLYGFEIGNEPDEYTKSYWGIKISSYQVTSNVATFYATSGQDVYVVAGDSVSFTGFVNNTGGGTQDAWLNSLSPVTVVSVGSNYFTADITHANYTGGAGCSSAWTYDSGSYNLVATWKNFRGAILASVSGAFFTGPADAISETTWTYHFGEDVTSTRLGLLTQHYYETNTGVNGGSGPTVGDIVTYPDPNLLANFSTDTDNVSYTATNIGVPYRITECNSCSDGGQAGVSNAYCTTLWVLDFLLTSALYGNTGCNFHGGGTGTSPDNYYTPITDDGNGTVTGANPIFYGMMLLSAVCGIGNLYETSAITVNGTAINTATTNLSAYAMYKSATGGYNLIVVNKDLTTNFDFTVTLPVAFSAATLYFMTQGPGGTTAPSLSAAGGSADVTIQGSSVNNTTGAFTLGTPYILTLSDAGKQVSFISPMLSAVLIKLTV